LKFEIQTLARAQAPAYNAYQRAQAANVNLNGPVQEFCQRVRDWPQRRAGMAIAVRHIKQRDLPPSCFSGGAGSSLFVRPEDVTR